VLNRALLTPPRIIFAAQYGFNTVHPTLKVYDENAVKPYCSTRVNETKTWQSVALLDTHVNVQQALNDAAQFGIRYVLIGICEDLGPRANLGNGGSHQAWPAFLQYFLNQPVNQFNATQQVLLLGEIDVDDVMAQAQGLNNQHAEELAQLRKLCATIDERVEAVLTLIFNAGLEPIIIGGGHNNSFGILSALSKHSGASVNAINFDPHADLRPCEGRHSGNGFSYALRNNALQQYHIIGLHEQKNNQAIFDLIAQNQCSFHSYQAINIRREISLTDAVQHALAAFNNAPLGIELDLDSISFLPASAYTCCGFSVSDAEHYVYLTAKHSTARYLHLCEAAPLNHPAGLTAGMQSCGQIISALVNAYLHAKTH